jgi:hypothetical protein
MKVKDVSYSGLGTRWNLIPRNVSQYTADEDSFWYYSINNRYFSTGKFGPISFYDTDRDDLDDTVFHVGGGSLFESKSWWKVVTDTKVTINEEDYYSPDYLLDRYQSRSLFFDYIKSRKTFTEINNLNSLGNGIYFLKKSALSNGVLKISSNYNFSGKKAILYVDGKVVIDTNLGINSTTLEPDSSSIVFIAPQIEFSDNAEFANGIFIARSIAVAQGDDNQSLKVNGNIIATESFVSNRKVSDNSYPAMFLNFDPNIYMDLFSELSTSYYIWE